MTLDGFEKIQDETTPGPWKYDWGNWSVEINDSSRKEHRDEICLLTNLGIMDSESMAGNPYDGEYIAACREMVPKLIKLARAAWDDFEANIHFGGYPQSPKLQQAIIEVFGDEAKVF